MISQIEAIARINKAGEEMEKIVGPAAVADYFSAIWLALDRLGEPADIPLSEKNEERVLAIEAIVEKGRRMWTRSTELD